MKVIFCLKVQVNGSILVWAARALCSILIRSPFRTRGRNSLSCMTSVVNFSKSLVLTLTKPSWKKKREKINLNADIDLKWCEDSILKKVRRSTNQLLQLICTQHRVNKRWHIISFGCSRVQLSIHTTDSFSLNDSNCPPGGAVWPSETGLN